jgi:extracellular factor (EF) 3-hydroxypalmitic acid methyl ester biosynthesis protein
MKLDIADTDSLVLFRNIQGREGRGTLLHLTRNQAVFEVYDATSIVQLSEILKDVRILRGDRAIYTGRAVVGSLVPTGLMGIVSATLLDPWQDLDELAPGVGIREETKTFVEQWEEAHALRPTYQLAVGSLRSFLSELNRWLSHAELILGPKEEDPPPHAQREFAGEVEATISGKTDELFGRFEEEGAQVPDDEAAAHKAYARKDLHPLVMCSPFLHRAYTKPLGYAGDYQMVNMILGDPFAGANTYAKIVNSSYLRAGTALAHRNRISMLTAHLKAEAQRVAREEGRPLRVLNVGCGPAREVQDFVRDDPLSEQCSFDLLDFNEETVEYAESRLRETARRAGRKPRFNFVCQSIYQLLKEASKRAHAVEPAYDLVYCAGLFDYLEDRICGRLLRLFFQRAFPHGLVLATNVHPSDPMRYAAEHLLEWYLIRRDETDLLALAPPDGVKRVVPDPTGVNIFLEIRKEGAAA